ncbi:MAG: hypothetical protein KJO21_00085 [Verrucomicrobiae bacterium]|nr:hypothetical protein [Verrucomicrobiae bacterium]NNJ41932.1 hypothetical protein [Akkermansiaceae bacterium]
MNHVPFVGTVMSLLLWTAMVQVVISQEPELAPQPLPRTLPDPAAKPDLPVPPDGSATLGAREKAGVSRFGKISVVGSNQNARGGILSMAEAMRVQLNKLCNDAARKIKLPIIIQLHGEKGDAAQPRSVVSRIEQLHGQYQLRLHVHMAKGVDHQLLRYHLMEMLLYERGLGAGQVVVDDERVLVKPWLIVGMLEAIELKSGQADQRIYQTDIAYFEILSLQELFDASEKQWREMDGRRPLAFRAISGAMVNSLLRQPKGRPSMAAYLQDVATFKGETENLMRKHFPGMNQSRNSLEKWVNLAMLELGTARVTQVHSILETENRLESILKLRFRDAQGAAVVVGVDRYREIAQLQPAQRHEAVAGARAELGRLSYRCFPTYRPLIAEYEMILREVIAGQDHEITSRLTQLIDVRVRMKKSGERARDYLDWYYITESDVVSGDFTQYRALIQALEKEGLRPPADDSTLRYLDHIQRVFGADASSQRTNRLPIDR